MSKVIEKIAVIAVTLLIWMVAARLRPTYEERTGRTAAVVQLKHGARQIDASQPRTSPADAPRALKTRTS